jgi:5-formyltetrahydrofolate cyclo-ligase
MDPRTRKRELREAIWERLREKGVDRFPGAQGRIPNFKGAEAAADRLSELDGWRWARHLKCNPDSPQLPARKNALAAGKTVYMAVPRLLGSHPFIALDPDRLSVPPHRAASIRGAGEHGVPVDIADMPRLDLVLAGSVAVSRDGARLGKGGGYSDLEFALASQAGLITADTVVITTVHEVQILEDGEIPMTAHDVPLDLIATPDEIITTAGSYRRPEGIFWDELADDKLTSIPILMRLKQESGDH